MASSGKCIASESRKSIVRRAIVSCIASRPKRTTKNKKEKEKERKGKKRERKRWWSTHEKENSFEKETVTDVDG